MDWYPKQILVNFVIFKNNEVMDSKIGWLDNEEEIPTQTSATKKIYEAQKVICFKFETETNNYKKVLEI